MPSSCGYDIAQQYTMHVLLTPHLANVLVSFSSAISSCGACTVECSALAQLATICVICWVCALSNACGRTQADKVEACSDTVPLGLVIESWRSEQASRFTLPQVLASTVVLECLRVFEHTCSFARFVPDLRGKHGFV